MFIHDLTFQLTFVVMLCCIFLFFLFFIVLRKAFLFHTRGRWALSLAGRASQASFWYLSRMCSIKCQKKKKKNIKKRKKKKRKEKKRKEKKRKEKKRKKKRKEEKRRKKRRKKKEKKIFKKKVEKKPNKKNKKIENKQLIFTCLTGYLDYIRGINARYTPHASSGRLGSCAFPLRTLTTQSRSEWT
jgi:amino acid permease